VRVILKCSVVPCKIEDKPFVFISYSHSDAHYVFPVLEGVAAGGYNIWYDHGIDINTAWSDEIANAIVASEILVVFVSRNSMTSTFVRAEVEFALSKNVRVVPVYLEGMGVLPPGLALAFHSTQGIMSHDADVIVSKLNKWLVQNVGQESWLPVKSSIPSISVVPKPFPPVKIHQAPQEEISAPDENDEYYRRFGIRLSKLEGDAGGKKSYERKKASGISVTTSRPHMAKLLFLVFFVNATEILIAYNLWGIFQRSFFSALLNWGLTSVVIYWYFFRRCSMQVSFLDRTLPHPEMVKSVLYWSFLIGWMIHTLDSEHLTLWLLLFSQGFALAEQYLSFIPFVGSGSASAQYYLSRLLPMPARLPQLPFILNFMASFACISSGALLVLDAIATAVRPLFSKR